jgi:hypothetical protein
MAMFNSNVSFPEGIGLKGSNFTMKKMVTLPTDMSKIQQSNWAFLSYDPLPKWPWFITTII